MNWVVYDVNTRKVKSVHKNKEDAKFRCVLQMDTLYTQSMKKVGETI